MPATADEAILETMEAINRYCQNHPQAADNITGISQYWLGGQTSRYARYEVECALESLVSAGWLTKHTNYDGEIIYSAAIPPEPLVFNQNQRCTMKYTIENLTRRPVSFFCNSGKACHLPPKLQVEFAANEIEGNAFIEKLHARRLLKIVKPAGQARKAPPATADKPRQPKPEAKKEEKKAK